MGCGSSSHGPAEEESSAHNPRATGQVILNLQPIKASERSTPRPTWREASVLSLDSMREWLRDALPTPRSARASPGRVAAAQQAAAEQAAAQIAAAEKAAEEKAEAEVAAARASRASP